MKKLKSIAFVLLVTVTATLMGQDKKIDTSKSVINWVGKKVTGEHSGTINVKSGVLTFKNEKLIGGSITIDMNSINTTDISGDSKASLDGHLKADDFFGTGKFPTSSIIFKKVELKSAGVYTIMANLTIKGVTSPVTFNLTVTANSAATELKIDRTKYGIKYGSGSFFDNLGDKTISNDFDLKVNLVF